ncbi:MAG: DUF4931 domain-containing protein [Patescibacteria group bacterium]
MNFVYGPKELRRILLERRSAPSRSEIRRDYIQEKYAIIAPQRVRRPQSARGGPIPPARLVACVLCPSAVNRRKDIVLAVPSRKRWQIAVVPNKYPAVARTNRRAYGVQEVVIETPDPQKQLEELGERHIAQLLRVYAERTVSVTRISGIEYILIFKNSGGRAGASLQHSHSQIFATALIPPQLADKSQKTQEYRRRFGSCVYCDVLKIEIRGPRFVYRDGGVVAFTPYASMHNYEVWILPLRHIDNITDLTARERNSWARLLRKTLRRIGELGLSYNYYFHQVVKDKDQHLYMKITPRGSVWAGVEIGSGVIVNPVAPESAARYYRS